MGTLKSFCFVAAGLGLLAGALLHIIAFIGGPEWIAFVGAPASVVESAAKGTWLASVGTSAITALLIFLAVYCFSAADHVRALPHLRKLLSAFAVIFIIRGIIAVPVLVANQTHWQAPRYIFFATSSAGILIIGLLLLVGIILHPASGTNQSSGATS